MTANVGVVTEAGAAGSTVSTGYILFFEEILEGALPSEMILRIAHGACPIFPEFRVCGRESVLVAHSFNVHHRATFREEIGCVGEEVGVELTGYLHPCVSGQVARWEATGTQSSLWGSFER